MQSSLLFSVLLVAASMESIVLGIPVTDDFTQESCDVRFTTYDTCSGTLSVSRSCKASMFNLTDSFTSELCTWTNFFWSYPTNNLTIIIETPFTKKQQNYEIRFENDQMKAAIEHVYRLIDGKEIDVTTDEKTLIQKSDSNYQIILKLQAPPELIAYGVYLVYEVVQS